jgi:hypothetical protein
MEFRMLSPINSTIVCPVGGKFVVRSHRKVSLGPLVVDIRCNQRDFSELCYFPGDTFRNDSVETHYTLSFCNLSLDGPWSEAELAKLRDRTYRGGKFSAGYYVTDHFGSPAYLITRPNHLWVFARDFALILWPYVVKLMLTIYAIERQVLHLKAAAIAHNGAGTLLIGRGGSGKTLLLTRLCQAGAQFLSNTHTLVDECTAFAVPTAMRVRNDPLFAPIIASHRLPAGIKTGEYLADPLAHLGWRGCSTTSLKNIFLLDYRTPQTRIIRELDRDVVFEYMEQFALALNVYGLKEDILDHLGGDIGSFALQMGRMRASLRALVNRCRTYYISCDVMQNENLECISGVL